MDQHAGNSNNSSNKMASSLNRICMIFAAIVAAALAAFAGQQVVEAALFDPLVETGVSKVAPEGRHVAVHVPGFFNMALDTRGPGQGVRISQSVMSGLVNIFIDREKIGDSFRGPIKVKVGGLTMYNNGESALSSDSGLAALDDTIRDSSGAADLASGALTSELSNQANRARDQIRQQGSQLTNRLSSLFQSRQNSQ